MNANMFWGLSIVGLMILQSISNASIVTVKDSIPATELGKTLVHEHIMCDFIGAKETSRERYDSNQVVETMLPFLQSLRERGFTGFVDCTPAYIGRDAEVLKRLSDLTNMHILTNTGYYGAAGDKFVPQHAFEENAEKLAVRWTKEWENGVDSTDIKPGFIKTGVDPGHLSDIDYKLVKAAAKTHLKTGLTIACHTGESQAALEVLETVLAEGIDASALIIVHANNISEDDIHVQIAEAGAWLEYDGVSDKSIERHVELVIQMVEKGFSDQILLSHDAGWYRIGEPDGGKEKIRSYNTIADKLIPALKEAGIDDKMIHKLLVDNPAKAFAVRVRKN